MHVAVTGASSGIGEALVREYVAAGAAVTLVARRKERLLKIAAETGGKTFVVGADLGDPERACEWIEPAQAALGPIDVLVNNAGVQIVCPTETTDIRKGEDLLRLNVFSPFRLTLAVLPGMLARKQGTIVDIASMAALTPTPGMYYYSASKAALAAASESLRGELRTTGVHVVTVYPGPVHTPMGDKGQLAYEPSWSLKLIPWGNATDLARRIRRAVEQRKPRVIYPRFYALSRRIPNLARWFVLWSAPKLKRD
jgi:short-subunit dehydrogenase